MRSLIQNKRGGFTDLFLFIIFTFVIVLFCGIFVFIANETEDQMEETIATNPHLAGYGTDQNASVVLKDTLGFAVASFDALFWIAGFLIFGMIIAIFIGSYMVTTKPIFFIPYLFIVIIAVIISVGISNAYETLYDTPTLTDTFANFVGANWILAQLPIVIAIVGMAGGIIMFSRMGKREEGFYGQ